MALDERGSVEEFLAVKTALMLASIIFISAALSLSSTFQHQISSEELDQLAESIIGAIRDVEKIPGAVELVRSLPQVSSECGVSIKGEWRDQQRISIEVDGEESIVREIFIQEMVNGGNFSLVSENPRSIIVVKRLGTSAFPRHEIKVELM